MVQSITRRGIHMLVTLAFAIPLLMAHAGVVAQEASPAASPTASAYFELVWEIKGGAEPFNGPVSVAVDPNGTLFYVSNGDSNNIQVFDPDGRYLRTVGERGSGNGQFMFDGLTVHIAVDGDGNLWVGDHKNPRVQKFDRDGNFLLSFGSFGTGDGQFINPWGIGVDAAGNVLVLDDQRVDGQWFDPNGVFLGVWPEHGDPAAAAPGLFSTDKQGHLWMGFLTTGGDFAAGEFDADGKLLRTIGSPGTGDGQYELPLAVVADAAGYIYISDRVLRRIQVFDPAGNYLTELTGSGIGDDLFRENAQIALSPDSQFLYVPDWLGDRVLKFRLLPPLASAS